MKHYPFLYVIFLLISLSLPRLTNAIDFTGIGYITYGDMLSYSLPIAQIQDGCTTPGCPFHVPSTPGHIKDLVVIATGASGGPLNTNFAGMDNAYPTPNGPVSNNFFSTGTVTDPGQVSPFFNDQDTTWDTSLAALKAFLDGDSMVIMYNNNNNNGGNLQSLGVWGQIRVTDGAGLLVATAAGKGSTTNTAIYDLTNNGAPYGLVTEGGGGTFLGDPALYSSDGSGPTGGTNLATDYVLAGGPVCIDTDALPPAPVSCTNPIADEGPINHNLGADEVAYANVVPELDELLDSLFADGSLDLTQYTMHLELRLGCDPSLFGVDGSADICTGAAGVPSFGKNINNGYEQVFITTASIAVVPIPEPTPGVLILTGLLFMRKFGYTRTVKTPRS